MTNVQLITGFLGAGKTTLLNLLLPEYIKTGKTVIIENDFGNANIDAELLRCKDVHIKELSSGCICCSLFGDLLSSMEQMINDINPDFILIEPSGLSCSSDVLRAAAVLAQRGLLVVSPPINVVDASNFSEYIEDFGNFYTDQIERAGFILLSHCEEVTQDTLDFVWDKIGSINPHAIKINQGLHLLTIELVSSFFAILLKSNQQKARNVNQLDVHSAHSEIESISSWSIHINKPLSKVELLKKLNCLNDKRYGHILRAKGFCPCTEGGTIHFEYLPNHISIEEFARSTEIEMVVIGENLNTDELEQLWKSF